MIVIVSKQGSGPIASGLLKRVQTGSVFLIEIENPPVIFDNPTDLHILSGQAYCRFKFPTLKPSWNLPFTLKQAFWIAAGELFYKVIYGSICPFVCALPQISN